MFCPKCGQSQPSDAVRFCPRCGFPLAGVAELVAHDGVLAYPPAPVGPQTPSPRRKGVRQGTAIMLVGIFLVPLLALMHPLIGLKGEFAILGVIVFLAGLLRLLFAAIFADASPSQTQTPALYASPTQQGQYLDPRAPAATLSPGEFRPAPNLFARRHDTAEIPPRPPSVTDHTTRLLADGLIDQDDSPAR
jgi:hypothetical protein